MAVILIFIQNCHIYIVMPDVFDHTCVLKFREILYFQKITRLKLTFVEYLGTHPVHNLISVTCFPKVSQYQLYVHNPDRLKKKKKTIMFHD